MIVTLFIDSVERTSHLVDGSLNQSCTYYSQGGKLKLLDDTSYTLKNSADNYSDIQIKFDGVLFFRGIILNYSSKGNREVACDLIDYAYKLADKPISVSCLEVQAAETTSTAKDYIKYILDTYFSGVFTYDLQETVTEYARDFKGRSALSIIRELAILEEFVFKLEPQTATAQKVIFQPETHEDLNIFLRKGHEIIDFDFPKVGSKVKNIITVVGKSGSPETEGITITLRNSESILAYGEREFKVVDNSLTSLDQVVDRADFELKKRAFPLATGVLEVFRDVNVKAGGIVYLTIADEGFSEQAALVLDVNFSFFSPFMKIKVTAITTDISEIMAEIVDNLRLTEERFVDADTLIKSVERHTEAVTITLTTSVERRDATGGTIGKVTIGTMKIGSLPTATFLEVEAAQTAKSVNSGITALLRIVGQISPSNLFDGTYSYCAIGTGSAAAKLTDTTLVNELTRVQVESGFPSSGATVTTWEFIVTDSELLENTSIYEIGLFDASSAGNMICRLVLDTPISKSAGEELKFIIKLKLEGANMDTTAEKEMRDMLTGLSTDYLDASNASIEILGTDSDRDGMDTDYPKLKGGTLNILECQTTFEVPADLAVGQTENQIKLFNELAAGVTMLDASIADLQTISQQDILVKAQIKVVNSEL